LGWMAGSVPAAVPVAMIGHGTAARRGIVETHDGCGPAGIDAAGVGGDTPFCVPNGRR
jgi:hypothetical protein